MPEHVFIDLEPDLCDVPAETWQGIDPKKLRDFMLSKVPEDRREAVVGKGLRALTQEVRVFPPAGQEYQPGRFVTPRLAQILEHARQRELFEHGESNRPDLLQ